MNIYSAVIPQNSVTPSHIEYGNQQENPYVPEDSMTSIRSKTSDVTMEHYVSLHFLLFFFVCF